MSFIQPSLYEYPQHPGWKKRETSLEAAEAIASKAQTLRDKVYQLLRSRPCSADEAARILGETVLSVRPRFSELAAKNKIKDSGKRDITASKKRSIIWEAK